VTSCGRGARCSGREPACIGWAFTCVPMGRHCRRRVQCAAMLGAREGVGAHECCEASARSAQQQQPSPLHTTHSHTHTCTHTSAPVSTQCTPARRHAHTHTAHARAHTRSRASAMTDGWRVARTTRCSAQRRRRRRNRCCGGSSRGSGTTAPCPVHDSRRYAHEHTAAQPLTDPAQRPN
jgi:hypothetical protein